MLLERLSDFFFPFDSFFQEMPQTQYSSSPRTQQKQHGDDALGIRNDHPMREFKDCEEE